MSDLRGSSGTRLDAGTYLDHLRRESARFRDAVAACDPTTRVPGCPDWDADDLLWHLTEVQWFWATTLRTRPLSPDERDEGQHPRPERPGSREELLVLFDACSADLVDQLAELDPAEPAWSWSDDHTVGFTFRRQAHEALVHRLDAEQTREAGGGAAPAPFDPALAADGVAELLDVMYGGEPPSWASFDALGTHVRLDLVDVGVSLWAAPGTLTGTDPDSGRELDGPHVLLVDDPGREAEAVVTGTAGLVDAWLWRRAPGAEGAGVEVTGDPATLAAFRGAVDFPLD